MSPLYNQRDKPPRCKPVFSLVLYHAEIKKSIKVSKGNDPMLAKRPFLRSFIKYKGLTLQKSRFLRCYGLI
nr:MAG TPA: hypothetical protein [Caudoviricetes sp.]